MKYYRIDSSKELGKLAEQLAKKFLQKKGYRFLEQNWRCQYGEIDLVFIDKNDLVVVEVKSRLNFRSCDFNQNLFSNIDQRKIKKLKLLLSCYRSYLERGGWKKLEQGQPGRWKFFQKKGKFLGVSTIFADSLMNWIYEKWTHERWFHNKSKITKRMKLDKNMKKERLGERIDLVGVEFRKTGEKVYCANIEHFISPI